MARLYVVDDDAAVLAQLVNLFINEGHEAKGFANPLHLLDIAINQAEPSVIVCDMRMPQLSGLDLKDRLRGNGVETPIVFVSGESTHEEIIRAVDDPLVRYLLKPVFPHKLLATVQQLIAQEEARIAADRHSLELRQYADRLIDTQKRIYALLLRSMNNQEIARELNMKPDTVKKHRQAVFEKFGVASVFQLLEIIRNNGDAA